MTDSTDPEDLAEVPFFKDCDVEERTHLSQYVRRESYREGDFIIRTGSEGDKIYFLTSGRVRVSKVFLMNLEHLGYQPMKFTEPLRTFGPGYHFGEMALLGSSERSADVIAEEDCELLSISRDSFHHILNERSGTAQKMLLHFCNSLASWIRTYEGKLKENIQNRTLIEMLKAEKKKIAAMHKITRSTVFSTVGQVLDTILNACMDCLNVEKGSLMVFKHGYLSVDAAFGMDRFAISGKLQEVKEHSVSGRCFMSGQPLLIEDISKVEGLSRSGGGENYFNNSLLSVPLISLKGETIGVLNVNNKTSREVLDEGDRAILQDLAQEAGATLGYEIELARLLGKIPDANADTVKAGELLALKKDKIRSSTESS